MVATTITLLVLVCVMLAAYIWHLRRCVQELVWEKDNAKVARTVSHSDYIGQLQRVADIKDEIRGAMVLLQKAQNL